MKKRLLSLALVTAVMMAMMPVSILADGVSVMEDPKPYAYSNAKYVEDDLIIGGTEYDEGLLFDMGYTGLSNGGTSVVSYNLDGNFTSMSFYAGYSKGDDRNAKLTIIADGVVLVDEDTYDCTSIARQVTLPVTGVRQLTFQWVSDSYDSVWYGIGDIEFVPADTAGQTGVLTSDSGFQGANYYLQNAKLQEDRFSMGGHDYRGAYFMNMGYTGRSDGDTSIVGFNFKNQYSSLDFDIGKYMNRNPESYTRSAFLTITVDGQVLPDYDERELKWNDLALPVHLDLTGVSEVKITLVSDGYDKVTWAVGDIHYN